MKVSIRKGLGFGLTSGIITTLGLIIGLDASTSSKNIVIAGILIIAIADSLSDAFGLHISEEAEKKTKKKIWESTIATLAFKFIFALTFLVPVLLLQLSIAVILSIIWGLFLITIFSLHLAKIQKIRPYKVVLEHVAITVAVIVITYLVGKWIGSIF